MTVLSDVNILLVKVLPNYPICVYIMSDEQLTLIAPTIKYKHQFLAMGAEFLEEGLPSSWRYEDCKKDFQWYVLCRKLNSKGKSLPKSWVPWNEYWLLRSDDTLVGVSSLRHYLNEYLRNIAGHIGYQIMPSERKKGYGTEILRLTLQKAAQKKINPVLITCDEDNVGSIKIIEKNGGIFENTYFQDGMRAAKRRYWIHI